MSICTIQDVQLLTRTDSSEIEIKPKPSHHRYAYSNNDVGYNSPYGYPPSVTPQQTTMGYDISTDYVDSTTTYEPRSTMIDSDFIGHSKFSQSPLFFLYDLLIICFTFK